jgi:iron complex outermembrane receptor protein
MQTRLLLPLLALGAATLHAQQSKPISADSAAKLGRVTITATRGDTTKPKSKITQATLAVTASTNAKKVEETVNIIDTEDAVKYLPSVFLRKRNNGDTQAVMGTRVWGVSSSARSLVFVDGVPITALIANNNNIGAPRWGLVAPSEIDRIDMMYGPFSAAYAGNSMGAVMEITTRLPQKLEGNISQTQAAQTFDLYGTKSTFTTSQTALTVGDRLGDFSFWASGNYQNSFSQPLTYATAATFPTGTTGGYSAQNKLGANANVLGATGLLHTGMSNGTIKAAYDITPSLRAAYTFGYWKNDANSSTDPYIMKAGDPSFAGNASFASGTYGLLQQHTSQSLSLRTDNKSDWDLEAIGTHYSMDKDKQRSPTTAAATGLTFGAAGRVALLEGTNWNTVDLKAIWHAGGANADHTVSFGAHYDAYSLKNPTYNTPDWTVGTNYTSVFTEGDGKTRTQALWIQDSWRITPVVRFTFGGRYEDWRGYDGYNVNGATTVTQPNVSASKFSPKGALAWNASADWTITASLAQAYRFATASELYQLVSTGATFTAPNPNLKPDNDVSAELRLERKFDHASATLALFQDDIHDAIISQFLPLVPGSTQLYSYTSNVDHVRARGAELVVNSNDLLFRGFELGGSVTYVDARTLAISGQASATAQPGSSIGKRLPNIPDFRANFVATYRPDDRWAWTLAGRYSGNVYTTLDNSDVNPNVYQGFSAWFVADAKANFRVDRHWNASLGVDNLLDRKYFFFHPFPQRTFVGSVKYSF